MANRGSHGNHRKKHKKKSAKMEEGTKEGNTLDLFIDWFLKHHWLLEIHSELFLDHVILSHTEYPCFIQSTKFMI